jgi:aminoglycoside phosphotransferase (APT) family kinase protein
VLRKHGCLTTGTVTEFVVEGIGAEVGFLDSLARFTLTYDNPENTAPASLVIKVSSSEARYLQIGNFYDAYEREFHFYDQVAPLSPIRLPRCFGQEVDPESKTHVLLLEDLSSLSAGDQVAGLTSAQALAAVESIGRFHAAWWDQPRLETLAWMPHRNIQPARYQAAWPQFLEMFRGHLSQEALALGEQLNLHLESLLIDMEQSPHTVVHSDFRADNLLFDDASCAEPVVVVDWQLAIRGRGVLDVARLLCGSMHPQERAACERDLVKAWHARLEQGGVRGYSYEQAVQDYRRAALICLYYPVTIHTAEEAAGQRGTALAHAQIERFFTAAVELWKFTRR